MARTRAVKWADDVEADDYPAAHSYLSLIFDKKRVGKIIASLRKAPLTAFKAKDLFRASQLSLLGISNSQVEKNRRRIRAGKALWPILLVRDPGNGRVIVADGYHRMCAVYGFDQDAIIQCKIV